MAGELARNVAVLVFAPSDPSDDSQLAAQLNSLVEAGVSEERIGLSMITLDRSDPREQLLCRFMGLRPGGPDTLCVAFGRGKLMSPPLVGDEIDGDHIHTLVTQIRQACSCSLPLATMGVDPGVSTIGETPGVSTKGVDPEEKVSETSLSKPGGSGLIAPPVGRGVSTWMSLMGGRPPCQPAGFNQP